MKFIRFIFILAVITFSNVFAEAQIQVRVKFGEISNLTYQLDCVGDILSHCSRSNLEELWNREFLKTDDDRKMLKEWTRLRKLYSQDVQISEKNDAVTRNLSLDEKVRIAGFQAETPEDYAVRLDLLTAPSDRVAFERVINYFQPHFQNWWESEASKNGGGFAGKMENLLHSQQISGQIKQFYDFYAADLSPDYKLVFNLFYIPNTIKEPTGGQQIQNYSLMEFKPSESPAQRIDVAVHELNHFFYASRKAENAENLRESFYKTNRAGAIPAYNLLNETLATAFGNGMIARSVTPPEEFKKYAAAKRSFYNNDAIDRAAKAILPWLDTWLENKKTISDKQFAAEYVSLLEKEFGEDLTAPKLYLSEMFLFVDENFKSDGAIRRSVRQTLRPASFYASEGTLNKENLEPFTNNSRLNSLFIIRPETVKALLADKIITKAEAELITKQLTADGKILFSKQRAKYTYVYIAVAENTDEAQKLIEKLANAKQFDGIYKN